MTNEELDVELATFVHKVYERGAGFVCGHTFEQHVRDYEGAGFCDGNGKGCLCSIPPAEIEIEFLRSKLTT